MKVLNTLSAMNEIKQVKELKEKRFNQLKTFITQYEFMIQLNKTQQAVEIKRFAQIYWFEVEKEIEDLKRKLIDEELTEEAYHNKLFYMMDGFNMNEKLENAFTELEKCPRGYMTIKQDKEIDIEDGITTLKNICENINNSSSFTVYREHEIDHTKQPELGRVLYRINANGTLKKMKDNYRF